MTSDRPHGCSAVLQPYPRFSLIVHKGLQVTDRSSDGVEGKTAETGMGKADKLQAKVVSVSSYTRKYRLEVFTKW